MASYSYDTASELTGITYTNGGAVLGDLQYSYDAAGHRTTFGGSLAHINLRPALASAGGWRTHAFWDASGATKRGVPTHAASFAARVGSPTASGSPWV